MNSYALFVQNRETKSWELSPIVGEAKSRRAFIRANADAIRPFRTKAQFKVRAV